ncbi:MAG: hypothetical protein DLM68_00165 [Hyphomicrobiales bacterium]|nr:MAG: hypothetical protein DLM68_00165 [Hyphomicrobiales bacterium]
MCGAAAHDDRKIFRHARRRFDGEGLGKLVFRQPPSDLFIDFARQSTDVLPGSGNRREDHSDSRVPPGSICPFEENKPFAVQ